MSAAGSRPTRRAAASRRKAPVVESDEEEVQVKEDDNDGEEEFTPAPKTSRRANRRQTASVSATPQPAARSRRTRATESIEPPQVFEPENEAPIPASPSKRRTSPTKKPTSRKRKIPDDEEAANESTVLPTPSTSKSPENVQSTGALADITETALNEQGSESVEEPEAMDVEGNNQDDAPPPAGDLHTPKIEPTTQESARPSTAGSQETVTQEAVRPSTAGSQPADMGTPMEIVAKRRAAAIVPKIEEPTGPQARLVITYLVLTNFKSYAGRQEVGPFHASFSSVVGPNGSGKSNVIDSLLFVFGFRASKMRQGKISALIHNSARHPDLDYCEVEVYFQQVMDQPGGGSDVIPDTQLVVARRAFKNNSSKYYINGKESTFTVVTTMLKDQGIDLDHKRFLILQGEVESIAQMKAKAATEHDDGLLEYLEDIIGTSKYKAPIEEAAVETEALNEVCMEKSSRVQHVEKEKNGLEDKKNKALAYIREENELATKQSALYQIYIEECSDTIQANQEAVAQMKASLDEELRKHDGSEEIIKDLEKQYKAGKKELERLEKDTAAVREKAAKLDKETVKFETKKKFLAGKQKKLETELEKSRFAISASETTIKNSSDDVERNGAEIEELELKLKVEDKELSAIQESMKGKTQGLSDAMAAKQHSLEPWKAKVNEKQSGIAVAQSELELLQQKGNAGAVAIAEVESKIVGFEETKAAKITELDECKTQKSRVEKEAKKIEIDLDNISKKEPTLKSKLSNARQKADEARSSFSATQSQGNVLSGLMRLKDSGRINGFHGRLGNLGAIDQKYDVAISTACPSLDNLVVDSVEVGQQCIEYLRKNNLGRANFILLDRLAKRDLSEIQTPEDVPRLFDLVKSKDAKFSPAFYSVLQNTLVADDLAQANRIAYGAQRWRVVTLDGQLIDKSGTMSGGGTRVAKGGMSSKLAADVTKEQVSKLEVDRETVEQEYQALQEQQRSFEVSLRDMQDQVPQLETKAQKLELEIESCDRNIADAQRRIKELAAEQQTSKSDKSRMSTLEKSIATMEVEITKLHAETAGVEEEIQVLRDKIDQIGGVQYRSQKAKVTMLREQISTLESNMSDAEISKSQAQKQKTRHEKEHAKAESDLGNLAVEQEKLETAMEAQGRDAAGTKQAAEEADEVLDAKKGELETFKKELEEKTAELNETRGVEIEMRNKLEESQKSLADTERKLRHWQDKLSKVVLHSISDLGEEGEAETIPTYTRDELQDMDKNTLKDEIAALEESTSNASVDISVLSEYRRRVEEHASRSSDLATAIASRDAVKARYNTLRQCRHDEFDAGFRIITLRLKDMYQMITMGGNAELTYVDSLDPFAEGIEFSVMPPKKSWKNISNLSGGEKTLSSLALVFALHHYKPTPLYVMDEIDAALDFRNVSIIAAYIKERTKNAQFIVISLRNNMFELASRLVGVYKVNHMTKSVTVENRNYMVGRA
ncbi:chromosomes protein 4 structural maintenance [Pseudovirgaria hyperparasitica]|uniref:Structural maintenance of chromosomes protein n=1 Tax=Pseudovirgaria hyperparasitica TaxID=470096 RepID=A0A6A6W848_9PEZI|nr:chromosomes protein 4 structural maintenance [Pseudovirgaria hyperparasitica]KAF2758130.1 chromosomes protein 4 structural maintenance [Pseudovirgaria hyperparasitica]